MPPIKWHEELLNLTVVLEKPWAAGLEKSRKAGEIFAKDVLANHLHGYRPLTLVGWGLGCRVIFYALLELAKLAASEDTSLFG
jgi:hypothetical protein